MIISNTPVLGLKSSISFLGNLKKTHTPQTVSFWANDTFEKSIKNTVITATSLQGESVEIPPQLIYRPASMAVYQELVSSPQIKWSVKWDKIYNDMQTGSPGLLKDRQMALCSFVENLPSKNQKDKLQKLLQIKDPPADLVIQLLNMLEQAKFQQIPEDLCSEFLINCSKMSDNQAIRTRLLDKIRLVPKNARKEVLLNIAKELKTDEEKLLFVKKVISLLEPGQLKETLEKLPELEINKWNPIEVIEMAGSLLNIKNTNL